jgi:hypothetical protein
MAVIVDLLPSGIDGKIHVHARFVLPVSASRKLGSSSTNCTCKQIIGEVPGRKPAADAAASVSPAGGGRSRNCPYV